MKIKMLFLAACIMFLFCGCGQSETWKDNYKLKNISVYTAAENSDNICIVAYPYNYISNGEWQSMESTAVDVEELSIEEVQYFYDYIVNLENPEYMRGYELYMDEYKGMYEGHTFTCAMTLEYEDYWGNEKTILRLCFDEYPENWGEFTERFNKVCGEKYLTDETKLQEMTPEYLQETMRFAEEDYSTKRLENAIEELELDMFDFVVDQRGMLSDYELDEKLTIQYLPREVHNVESTANEFGHFVSAFIRDNFGKAAFDDLDVRYYDNVSYCIVRIDGEQIRFFRSCRINEEETVRSAWLKKVTYHEEFEYYMWKEGSQEYNWGGDFYYNADGKYGIVGISDPEIIDAFVHAK